MLTLNNESLHMPTSDDPRRWALELYRSTKSNGWLRRTWRGLTGRNSCLLELRTSGRSGQRSLGRHTVAIAEIVGSEGRVGDFDNGFAPLSGHTRDRWVSVANARHAGKTLPPVQLIRTAEGYFVRDGHHRISVAHALGEEFIEAEVVSWE